ncbi:MULTISPECIES: hypothetical protein [unclassified Streptomyces]|uniref:hypothetical protein n=1 Tax=unclassified Streptomyces TaxID=2593676 RepID=UPI0013E02CE3|nr:MULTISPECIES: hypothetical protein [unclassified Streptomyces]
MDQDPSRSSDLPQPLRTAVSGLRRLPGGHRLEKAAGGALEALGALSPGGRRIAVYTGAGVLGVAGLVDWPVAVTGAAVAWLTRPRPTDRPDGERAAPSPADAHDRPGTADAARPYDRRDADRPAGPGDRLAPHRNRDGRTDRPVHQQPAKVGDTATAEGLKQVAEATAHHGPSDGPARPPAGRPTR